jgi:simple sugar transport system substrate-binding protein
MNAQNEEGNRLTRRRFATKAAAAAITAAFARPRLVMGAQAPLVIGFIYGGPKNDLGYNQAHFEGKQSLRSLQFVKAIDQANVTETIVAEEAMRDMIHQDGARVIFATSYGHLDPYVYRIARESPDVQFFHCGGYFREGVDPPNIGMYFGFIDEVEYLAGMTAGLMTRTGLLGFVAAKPIPQVLRNINSYMLGARSVNPSVSMKVVFTGDWVLPVREAEAASSLADRGADVLTGHTGSPRVIVQVAERRGIWATGYQFDQSVVAPHGFLTGAEWSWGVLYRQYAQMIHEGKSVTNGTIPRRMSGTLKDNLSRLSPFGPAVTPEMRTRVFQAKQELLDGTRTIYRGPLRNNKGSVVISAGTTIPIQDRSLDGMNWLLEGIQGDVGSL